MSKLYATATSEKASKGQGGQKQLEILLQVDPKLRTEVGRIVMKAEDSGYTIKYYPICGASWRATKDKNVIVLLDTTQPKSNAKYCKRCQERTFDSAGWEDDMCDKCFEKQQTKGEQQKGEKRKCTYPMCGNTQCKRHAQ